MVELVELSHLLIELVEKHNLSVQRRRKKDDETILRSEKLIRAYSKPKVISNYCYLLKDYIRNPPDLNQKIISMWTQLVTKCKLEPKFYQLSVLRVMSTILNDSSIQDKEEYEDMIAFCKTTVHHMFQALDNNPLLYVGLLFWKSGHKASLISRELNGIFDDDYMYADIDEMFPVREDRDYSPRAGDESEDDEEIDLGNVQVDNTQDDDEKKEVVPFVYKKKRKRVVKNTSRKKRRVKLEIDEESVDEETSQSSSDESSSPQKSPSPQESPVDKKKIEENESDEEQEYDFSSNDVEIENTESPPKATPNTEEKLVSTTPLRSRKRSNQRRRRSKVQDASKENAGDTKNVIPTDTPTKSEDVQKTQTFTTPIRSRKERIRRKKNQMPV